MKDGTGRALVDADRDAGFLDGLAPEPPFARCHGRRPYDRRGGDTRCRASAVSIDVDGVNNRVTLAVSDVGAQQRLAEAIRAVGVPEEAFVVQL